MPNPASARKPRQSRSRATRQKITEAVIALLGEHGEAAVTHRAIAERAGVSLAATTYYYDSRTTLLADASQALLDRYVAQFEGFVDRHRNETPAPGDLRKLVFRVIDNATSRDRQRTIAWAEIMVFCSRHADTRELAATWYSTLYEVWSRILSLMGETPDRVRLRVLIDQIVGLLFLMLPLHWKAEDVRLRLEPQPRSKTAAHATGKRAGEPSPAADDARNRIIEAAIRLLAREGSAAVTGRAVAAEAGVAPALPAYHFKPLDSLMSAARERLYEREKARYRQARTSLDSSELTPGRLADLTTAIRDQDVDVALRISAHYADDWRAGRPALVEIIKGEKTSDEALARVFDYTLAIGKTPGTTAAKSALTRRILPSLISKGLLRKTSDAHRGHRAEYELVVETYGELNADRNARARSRAASPPPARLASRSAWSRTTSAKASARPASPCMTIQAPSRAAPPSPKASNT